MKLRNKKTGEIATDFAYILLERTNYRTYNSISELCEDWEDYKPAEPLIKDKKIRKAVRAWAKMNMLEEVEVEPPTVDCSIISFTYGMLHIDFYLGRSDIGDGTYTIAELCGEDEE